MSSITAQQTKLDLELVPKENILDIGKCNGRIPRRLKPNEETFQVVLDALAITPCYPAFVITADVPEICPRVQGRDFDALPSKEDTISFLRDLGHTRLIVDPNEQIFLACYDPGTCGLWAHHAFAARSRAGPMESDKDKDEDPSVRPDRGLKKWETRKDVEPAKKEPEFEVADSDMPQNQEENPVNDDEEPKGKTPQKGQNQSWLMTLASTAKKPSKTFDELMSTLIDFSAFIMNGLKINNLTQETLLGPAFRLLKGTRSNYAELEYDFEECYKALSEKLDWENPEGGDYPFDLTKPLPLVMSVNQNSRKATFHVFMSMTSEDMLLLVVQSWLINISGGDISTFAICIKNVHQSLGVQKRVEDLQTGVDVTRRRSTYHARNYQTGIRKKRTWYSHSRPQGFIYVDNNRRKRLMRSDELYKFSDRTLDELYKIYDVTLSSARSVLNDIASNLEMDYLPKRHWSNSEMKRSRIMVKAIDKLLFERRLMRNLEKFIGGRDYRNDLRLLERTI
ncbi:hypothetical protein Tco_1456598 [Tanacetum coccineum]